MYFHEMANELKPYMGPQERAGSFVVMLVGDTLREPMDDKEIQMQKDKKFNPLESGISINMLDKIFEGTKFISKTRAGDICSRYDGQDFAEEIDNLYDSDKEHILSFLYTKGIVIEVEELGSAVQDILKQVFHGLSLGIHDVDIRLTIHDPKATIKSLAGDRIYCEDGKLFIDGEIIELPVKLSDSQIYDFEHNYISALCEAYAEALSKQEVDVDDIPTLPAKFQRNFYDARKAYLSAESIQRSISEVYEDGGNQFDILKEDAYYGVKLTYEDDYDTGYRRLLEVLKKISDVQLTKSKLMLIKNLIGNLERLGIVHILVNDGTIPSWVDPYAC